MKLLKLPPFDSTKEIPVMEFFYTLQGEGYHSGKPAWFIRLAGCDVGCTWCDVKESWTVNSSQLVEIEKLVDEIKGSPCRFVVITGGEPTLYNLEALTSALHNIGATIAIETSGTNPLFGKIDWICLSPKKFKPVLPEFYPIANELKVIVFNKHDFTWATELEKKVNANCKLYIQPEWDKTNEHMEDILQFIKNHPQWTLSLQTHKYLNIP